VPKLLSAVEHALAAREKRVTTGELNRFFEEVLERHPPPTMKARSVRLFYVTQAAVRPPTFVAVSNHPQHVHFSYQRYVQNQIRERFGFEGTPIRVRYRSKRKQERN
jgi:GTP-binding protein